MFLLRSRQPKTTRPALNAIPPAPDRATRRQRHLAICEELTELGMDLARAAHREGLRDMQPTPAPRTPIPGLSYADAPEPPARDSLFAQLFTLVSRCVRQTMLLEDRFASGDTQCHTAAPSPRASQPPPAAPASQDATRIHAERLYQEPFEGGQLAKETRPVENALDHIRSELGAASANFLPRHQTQPPPLHPLPIAPPGPKTALATPRPPKPPD